MSAASRRAVNVFLTQRGKKKPPDAPRHALRTVLRVLLRIINVFNDFLKIVFSGKKVCYNA